jgi:hypothetical protein
MLELLRDFPFLVENRDAADDAVDVRGVLGEVCT